MKKAKKTKRYIVPMRWTMQGFAFVDATSEQEAIDKCDNLDGEFDDSTAEMVDWETTGKAKEDE